MRQRKFITLSSKLTSRRPIMAKGRRGLDSRHRDRSGKIEKKHGNTRIGSLRKEYGDKFARGRRKDMMLKTLLKETECTSLHEYLEASPQIGLGTSSKYAPVK
jgi:hypothetical protein